MDAATRTQLGNLLCHSLDDSTASLHHAQALSAHEWQRDAAIQTSCLTLLSLSSYQFHSLVLVVTDSARATFEVTDDFLLEMGNTICGSLKRKLSQHLPNLGMSTPHALSIGCLPMLLEKYQQPLVAICHDRRGMKVSGWLLIPEDFTLKLAAHDVENAENTGELELF